MTRCLFFFLLVLCSMSTVSAQKPLVDMGKLRSLDLLFVVSQASNAITEVTTGIEGYQIDHVGIVRKENGKTTVIEAVYEGVREISLDDFMRTAPVVLVGRLAKPFDKRQTIFNVMSLVGRPYDFVYRTGLETVYCSELVSESYVDRHGKKLFPPVAMSFHDASGIITPYWIDFYSRRGMDVPEGEPGTNPGELSRREAIKIKYLIRNFVK